MSKKLIGLKLADGTFYPVLKEGIPEKKHLKLTASGDNQTSMKIELFKASDDSFQDAEYIQTLVLDQMIPQKKEDHLIDFVVNLDENNNLKADLNDAKSGIEKTATISLPVSGDDDFVIETPVIGASDELSDFNDIDINIEETAPASAESADSIVEDFLSQPFTEEGIATAGTTDEISDKSLPDFGDFDTSTEAVAEESFTESLPDFDDIDTSIESSVEEPAEEILPDFNDFDTTAETSADDIVLESPVGETAEGLPVFDDIEDSSAVSTDAADSVVEDFLSQPVTEEGIATAGTTDEISDKSLPDFGDFDTSTETVVEESSTETLPDFGNIDTSTESFVEESSDEALPDFGDFDTSTELYAEDPSDGTLPDFKDFDTPAEVAAETSLDESLPDFSDIDASVENSLEDSSGQVLPDSTDSDIPTETVVDEPREEELPDFGDFDITGDSASMETTGSEVEEADLPSFDDSDFDDAGFAAAATASFADSSVTKDSVDDFSPENFDIDLQLNSEDDLYSMDLGDDADSFESAPQDRQSDDDTYTQSPGITDFDFLDKKTRIPFVPLVCIICAVVSLLCMLGMFLLFLNGKSKNTVPVQPTAQEQRNSISVYTQETEIEKPVQAAVARDNVIVVVDSPVVVPSVPEKIVTAADEKKYKVKWGDTLWDIAESYYKNPWMYKKIASVNNIKNPDFILSGTWIVLPPK